MEDVFPELGPKDAGMSVSLSPGQPIPFDVCPVDCSQSSPTSLSSPPPPLPLSNLYPVPLSLPPSASYVAPLPPPPLSYPADWIQDVKQQPSSPGIHHVRFAPVSHPYARSSMSESQRVKRPMNSFMVFSNEMRPLLQEQNKSLTNNDVSKILGNMWKEMTPEQKKPYIDRAIVIKAAFTVQHPDYVYTKSPRKRQKSKLTEKAYMEGMDVNAFKTPAQAAMMSPAPAPPPLSAQLPAAVLREVEQHITIRATPDYVHSVALKVANEMQCTFDGPQCSIL